MEVRMDFAQARCAGCRREMQIDRVVCPECGLTMEGEFEVSTLGRLSPQDQLFVTAFVRHHGSIKKMEHLFGISYPTVKNRLNAITRTLDAGLEPPSPRMRILEMVERGE
ncbi:MAG: DUF2089 family protein, partial [Candidatus Eisenbacteria bacterium]|nr:DUF2089 family protein [Candidatus Latescibacterota bacterium]MBD3301499.1 DUF2089 family protein [Candidatus Eisenbacteria bacterium]